MDHRNESLL
jgi:hypothetical protein